MMAPFRALRWERCYYPGIHSYYLYGAITVFTVAGVAPTCMGGSWMWLISMVPAALLTAILGCLSDGRHLTGSVYLVALEVCLVALGLLRLIPTTYSLLPLPLLFVYSAAAYACALRMPNLGGRASTLAMLLLIGAVPLVAYALLESSVAADPDVLVSSVSAVVDDIASSATATLSAPTAFPVQTNSAVCNVIRAVAAPLAALVNCDRSLPARLRRDADTNGSFGSLMHDSGAGKRSYTPYYSDIFEFTDISPEYFGGAAGGASMTPGRGTIAAIGLDDSSPPRPYVYLIYDAAYAPSAVARLYASEPERQHDHHVCTRVEAQQRHDGSNIPFDIIEGHYWTDAVFLPAVGDPNLPPTTSCPRALRGLDWDAARRIARSGGGYLDAKPPPQRYRPPRRPHTPTKKKRNRRSKPPKTGGAARAPTLKTGGAPLLKTGGAPRARSMPRSATPSPMLQSLDS